MASLQKNDIDMGNTRTWHMAYLPYLLKELITQFIGRPYGDAEILQGITDHVISSYS